MTARDEDDHSALWQGDRDDAAWPGRDPWSCLTHARSIDHLAARAVAHLARDVRTKGLSAEALAAMRPPHVTAMAYALAEDDDAAQVLVADLLDAGVSELDVCIGHLAPAARALGDMWQRDALPFSDVALAASRVQNILRSLPGGTSVTSAIGQKGAIFATAPGETHTVGVLMAATHFRRLGWDITMLVGHGHGDLCERIAMDDRPIVGLSCSGEHMVSALGDVITDIRTSRPGARLVVSGHIASEPELIARLPDVDAVAPSVEHAEDIFEALLTTSVQSSTYA